MRTYSIYRPIGPGTCPQSEQYQVAAIKNFEERTFIPEIGMMAWGYADYTCVVPKKVLDSYELVVQEYLIMDTWELICKAHDLARSHEKSPADAVKYMLKKTSRDNLINCFAAYAKLRPSDGRISEKNRTYLYSNCYVDKGVGEWSQDNPLIRMGLDIIHPAHVDQLISELKKA